MILFEDDCEPGVELVVELGLITPGEPSGVWEVGLWDAALWGTSAIRTDVSQYVRAFSTSRQFSTGMRTWNAGSFSLVLHNRDGRFSSDNLLPGAPYVTAGRSGIRPRCPIWISMAYAGTTYPVFTGYVNVWADGWDLHSPRSGDAYVTATGYDEWGRLGGIKRRVEVAPLGAGDTYGQRVARILSSAGYSGASTIDPGTATYQATDLSAEVVTELNKVAESEGAGAAIWAETDGSIHARDRYSLVEDPRSIIVQIPFGDSVGEIPWTGISLAPLSDEEIVNHAVYTRTGGVVQEYTDAESVSLYGVCDDPNQPSDLMNETDAQVQSLAQWAVLLGKDPEARVNLIELKPRVDLATLAPLALSTKIRDLASVRLLPPSATSHIFYRECFISGISFDVAENDWTVKFNLSTATAHRRFSGSLWDYGLWGSSESDPEGALWFV